MTKCEVHQPRLDYAAGAYPCHFLQLRALGCLIDSVLSSKDSPSAVQGIRLSDLPIHISVVWIWSKMMPDADRGQVELSLFLCFGKPRFRIDITPRPLVAEPRLGFIVGFGPWPQSHATRSISALSACHTLCHIGYKTFVHTIIPLEQTYILHSRRNIHSSPKHKRRNSVSLRHQPPQCADSTGATAVTATSTFQCQSPV